MIPAKKQEIPAPTIEAVLMKGDLSQLTEEQRLEYYNSVCRSIGLNPLTRPFEYIVLNSKLQLYARKDATDQLRKLNSISVEIISQDLGDGLLTVHVRAKDQTGRTDEDIGSVAFPESLKGEIAANMRMKAVTKAKRRVTLSICGLGFLDETEIEDIPASAKQQFHQPPPADAPKQLAIPQLANNAGPDYRAFSMELLGAMRNCTEMADVFAWAKENESIISEMSKRVPNMHKNLVQAIEDITSAAT